MDELPDVNVPLLRKAVEWAEAEAAKPERDSAWEQSIYVQEGEAVGRSCGTACCIAGYVYLLDHSVESAFFDIVDIPGYAEKALGITEMEAWSTGLGLGLFDMDNTIQDVRRIAERIAARAGDQL